MSNEITNVTYLRVMKKAGGFQSSDRAIIKALHSFMDKEVRSRKYRWGRHSVIREILDLHHEL